MPEYDPNKYTPQEIDEGQRRINFALTEADRKLLAVLVALKNAINETSGGQTQKRIADMQTMIDEAIRAIDHVAEIVPPGCASY